MLHSTYKQTFIEETDLIDAIELIVGNSLQIDINIRFTLDGTYCDPYRIFLPIQQKPDNTTIISNLASLLSLNINTYITKAKPGDVLFDMEKAINSHYFKKLIQTEIRKMLAHIEKREDLAGRVLRQVNPIDEITTTDQQLNHFSTVVQKGLDLHLGYKLFFQGDDFIKSQLFLPVLSGNSIIHQIYTNIEKILIQNFAIFDESGTAKLSITETLIFKEVQRLLVRLSNKPTTRKKILKYIDNTQTIELFETPTSNNLSQKLPDHPPFGELQKPILKMDSELDIPLDDPIHSKPIATFPEYTETINISQTEERKTNAGKLQPPKTSNPIKIKKRRLKTLQNPAKSLLKKTNIRNQSKEKETIDFPNNSDISKSNIQGLESNGQRQIPKNETVDPEVCSKTKNGESPENPKKATSVKRFSFIKTPELIIKEQKTILHDD